MVGDPAWRHTASGKAAWESRQEAVYQYEMERKSWPMAWRPETWLQAQADNRRIDYLLTKVPADMMIAENDNYYFDWEVAIRDNAAFDYHHDHYLEDA